MQKAVGSNPISRFDGSPPTERVRERGRRDFQGTSPTYRDPNASFRAERLGFALRGLAAELVDERRKVAELRREVAELRVRLGPAIR